VAVGFLNLTRAKFGINIQGAKIKNISTLLVSSSPTFSTMLLKRAGPYLGIY